MNIYSGLIMSEDFQEFDRLKREMREVSNAMRTHGASSKEASNALRKFTGEASQLSQSLKAVGSSLSGFTSGLAKGNTAFSSFGSIVKSSTGVIKDLSGKFGIAGQAVGKFIDVAGAGVAFALEQYDIAQRTFQQLSQVGVAGADGIDQVQTILLHQEYR